MVEALVVECLCVNTLRQHQACFRVCLEAENVRFPAQGTDRVGDFSALVEVRLHCREGVSCFRYRHAIRECSFRDHPSSRGLWFSTARPLIDPWVRWGMRQGYEDVPVFALQLEHYACAVVAC